MQTIESELHKVLLEFDSDNQDHEDSAQILVEAAAIVSERGQARTAAKGSLYLDAILQASERFAQIDEKTTESELDDFSHFFASKSEHLFDDRYASKSDSAYYGDMNIVEDDDFDNFFKPDKFDDENYEIHDIYHDDLNRDEAYNSPGYPRHRSDFQVR